MDALTTSANSLQTCFTFLSKHTALLVPKHGCKVLRENIERSICFVFYDLIWICSFCPAVHLYLVVMILTHKLQYSECWLLSGLTAFFFPSVNLGEDSEWRWKLKVWSPPPCLLAGRPQLPRSTICKLCGITWQFPLMIPSWENSKKELWV